MATESTAPANATAPSELQYYACDDAALDAHRKSCPWKDDPVYFKKVSLSPSSVMKMVRSLLHSAAIVFTAWLSIKKERYWIASRLIGLILYG